MPPDCPLLSFPSNGTLVASLLPTGVRALSFTNSGFFDFDIFRPIEGWSAACLIANDDTKHTSGARSGELATWVLPTDEQVLVFERFISCELWLILIDLVYGFLMAAVVLAGAPVL